MAAILDISGLTKVFPARHGRAPVHALKHINLMLDEGDFIAVMGPSGCGKSTLLNIVAGFDRQDDGTCLVRDRPVSGPGPDRGMVFQEYALFPWMTVERNLVFAMRAAGKYNAQAPARIQATPSSRRSCISSTWATACCAQPLRGCSSMARRPAASARSYCPVSSSPKASMPRMAW